MVKIPMKRCRFLVITCLTDVEAFLLLPVIRPLCGSIITFKPTNEKELEWDYAVLKNLELKYDRNHSARYDNNTTVMTTWISPQHICSSPSFALNVHTAPVMNSAQGDQIYVLCYFFEPRHRLIFSIRELPENFPDYRLLWSISRSSQKMKKKKNIYMLLWSISRCQT